MANNPQTKMPQNDTELESLWDWNLTNHKPTDEAIKKIETLREGAKDFAEIIIKLGHNSRERAMALTNLEQTLQHAVASIVRYETDDGPHPFAAAPTPTQGKAS